MKFLQQLSNHGIKQKNITIVVIIEVLLIILILITLYEFGIFNIMFDRPAPIMDDIYRC